MPLSFSPFSFAVSPFTCLTSPSPALLSLLASHLFFASSKLPSGLPHTPRHVAARLPAIITTCCRKSCTGTDILYSGGGTVDFQEFVGGLSAFSSRGGRDEKLKCE